MKTIFSLCISVLFSISAYSQLKLEWDKNIGGSLTEYVNGIIYCTDGNILVYGSTSSNDHDITTTQHGYEDIYIVKMDMQRNIIWAKTYGGYYGETARKVLETSDGGFIVTGETSSYDGDVSFSHGGSDVWLIKLDAGGNIEWEKTYGGSSYEKGISVCISYDGGYIITGVSMLADGDVTQNYGFEDVWVIKTDAAGNLEWQKSYGGNSLDQGVDVVMNADRSYFLMSSTYSNTDDVNGNHGNEDYWLTKIDSMGNIIFSKCFGGSFNDAPGDMEITNDSNIVVTGYSSSADGDITDHIGSFDIWTLLLDTAGNIIWEKSYGTISQETSSTVIKGKDNELLICGTKYSHGDSLGYFLFSSYEDYYLVNTNSNGNVLWENYFGGSLYEYGKAICKTNDNSIIMAGISNSDDIDVTDNYGDFDMWLIKFRNFYSSGKVFLDYNENGILDAGEAGVANHVVRLDPGPVYSITNNNGFYYFFTPPGNYDVSYVPFGSWYTTGTGTINYTMDSIGQIIDSLNIGIKCNNNVQDVSVSTIGLQARAGTLTKIYITYRNWGTVTASGNIELNFDPNLTYISSSYAPASVTGNTLTYLYDTLGPGSQRIFYAEFLVPDISHLGDTIFANAFITPLVADSFLTNNYDSLQRIIVGPYDPNEKTVSPPGYGPWGYVEHGQRLTYTIFFQNTGTDTANTVVIRDTIDNDLDFGSFLLETSSHPVQMSLNEGNEIIFRFDNINLPDSNIDEAGSHGFIRYSISPLNNLAEGTEATNTAYIFFDYNPAIVTNSTLNTYVTNIPLSNISNYNNTSRITTYPNPSADVMYINLPEKADKLEISNINGEIIRTIIPEKTLLMLNVSDLRTGLYIVRIFHNGSISETKFIRE